MTLYALRHRVQESGLTLPPPSRDSATPDRSHPGRVVYIGRTETPIVPVLIGPRDKTFLFWRQLFDAGVFTNPVVPPAVPPSQCRLRTSLIATHTPEQIDFALGAFARLGKELGVI